ncbi:MAG: glycosyltransferase, partial [Saprospiraceae bacterium]|nr:glycosyltransferase [Saprospiraceae bacterium]
MMKNTLKKRIDVLIPAYNEEVSLPLVLAAIPKEWVREVLVCDNGSTDRTASVAWEGGARVIEARQRGYGSACLAGMRYLESLPPSEQPEIL